MSATPTKIQLEDLGFELEAFLRSLIRVKGDTFPTIYDRLANIGPDLMDKDTKKVVQDLIDGYNGSKKLTIPRIKDLELLMKVVLTDGLSGTQEFTYDEDENVTKHTIKNDADEVVQEIVYTYKDAKQGTLEKSVKSFVNDDKSAVAVTQEFTYDDKGNIKKIKTSTQITPPVVPGGKVGV